MLGSFSMAFMPPQLLPSSAYLTHTPLTFHLARPRAPQPQPPSTVPSPSRHAMRPILLAQQGREQQKRPPQQPPTVKPAFYKNPSKAIEKGGGFFIPGLRGPRLRYFVSAVALSLLTLNRILSPAVESSSLVTSEILAFIAITAVFATAVTDSVKNAATAIPTSASTTTSVSLWNPASTPPKPSPQSRGAVAQDMSSNPSSSSAAAWALAVCTDLTAATHIIAFSDSTITSATPNVDIASPPGAVVQRVAAEGRAIYLADSAELPPDVTLPFLPDANAWSAFVVPVGGAVVTFAAPLESKGFSVEDRRWLQIFAARIVGVEDIVEVE